MYILHTFLVVAVSVDAVALVISVLVRVVAVDVILEVRIYEAGFGALAILITFESISTDVTGWLHLRVCCCLLLFFLLL